jgi:hypothetical protein
MTWHRADSRVGLLGFVVDAAAKGWCARFVDLRKLAALVVAWSFGNAAFVGSSG